jgi:hypothetical protein
MKHPPRRAVTPASGDAETNDVGDPVSYLIRLCVAKTPASILTTTPVPCTTSWKSGLYCAPQERYHGTQMSSQEIDDFVTLARRYLTNAYPRIIQHSLTSPEYEDTWRLVRGVEAAVKLRRVLLEVQKSGENAVAQIFSR